MARSLKIAFVSPEVHPFAKSGGLADVAAALPLALNRLSHDVRIFMPLFPTARQAGQVLRPMGLDLSIPVGAHTPSALLQETRLQDRVPVYFIGHDGYFEREGLYGDVHGEFGDNAERFIFFCRAVLESCRALGFQPDIIHCNDWQTGLVPAYLKTLYGQDAFYRNTRTVFSIHNLGYQGNFWKDNLERAHLPWSIFNSDGVEFHDDFSFMKSGLVYADALTTVSPTYSREITTPEHGFRMDSLLRKRSRHLTGILNGVDYQEWNPETDPRLAKNYGLPSTKGKSACKKALAAEMSLKLKPRKPLFSIITRLTFQKGIDLVVEAFDTLMAEGAGLVLLGSGDSKYEDFFREKATQYPGQFACRLGFDETLAHQMLAGSDIFMMPSLYEPCGLTQMYAMRYGTVPLVRAVGGLADTVPDFRPPRGRGTGFVFQEFQSEALLTTVRKAMICYRDTAIWQKVMRNGMTRDFGWEHSAGEYIQLYRKTLK